MQLRILVFEDESSIRKPICAYLRAKGHEVLDFPSPATCAVVASNQCSCPRQHACADVIITDMNMPDMSGLDLVRLLAERGCHAPPQNKIVISSSLTPEQQTEFMSLGCHFLPKPFHLDELLRVVQACEDNILPDRVLTPLEELWKTARSHSRLNTG